MNFREIALSMHPFWVLGIFVLFAIYFSKYRSLLRVTTKPILAWIKILTAVTIFRIIVFSFFGENAIIQNMVSGAAMIPWPATLFVFWEDAVFGLPLAIASITLAQESKLKRNIVRLAIILVSIFFGSLHAYQGLAAIFLLSFYVPFILEKGREIGFGTIMICHIIYDLITIITIGSFFR